MARNAGNDKARWEGVFAAVINTAGRTVSTIVRLLRPRLNASPRAETMLLVGGLIGCAGIIVAAGFLACDLRARAIKAQEASLTSNALILAAHVDGLLQSVELVQSDLVRTMQDAGVANAQQYAAAASSERRHRALSDMVRALPFVNALLLANVDGKVLNFSRYWPAPDVNIGDREYFIAVTTGAADRVVSAPLISRTAGAQVFNLARRFNGPDGSLLGVITASIDRAYLNRLFGTVSPSPDAAIALLRTDGVFLARHPDGGNGSAALPAGTMLRALGNGRQGGILRNISPIDGQDRLFAVRALAHYPIALSIGRCMDVVLQPWQAQVRYLAISTGLLDSSLLMLVVVGRRHLRNRSRLAQAELSRAQAEAELAVVEASERSERELAAYYARFNMAVNSLSQGLCMFDGDRRLVLSNPRLAQIFGLAGDLLAVGTPLHEIAAAAVQSRALSEEDVDWMRMQMAMVRGVSARASIIWDLTNGRALSVHLELTPERSLLLTFEDITERRRNEARIAHMARHDALTGLPNRILFHERLRAAVALAARGVMQAVLCLDLDRFKNINDTLGHPTGDALLQAVTIRIRRCIRESDTVARLGGDEFAIILSSLQQSEDAALLAERLIQELSLPYEINGHQVVVGVSIGIALAPDDAPDADMLLKNADLALYRAKEEGRGCCRYFRPDMDAALQTRRRLEMGLRRGLAYDEFELHYQPVIRAETHRISAFEALLRWPRSDQPIGPSEFISVAEDMGLIIPMGTWILETACREAAGWPNAISVAVNLSPAQFRSGRVLDMVQEALRKSALDPARLELEITESVLLQDTEETLAVMHELRDLGVRISMDDFGTGYSSLSYLLKFPFDKVKIDRSFMTRLGEGGRSDAIIRAVTGMCRELGLQTIAEGVETPEQLAFLERWNCSAIQGFLFGRPIPAQDVPAVIAEFGSRQNNFPPHLPRASLARIPAAAETRGEA